MKTWASLVKPSGIIGADAVVPPPLELVGVNGKEYGHALALLDVEAGDAPVLPVEDVERHPVRIGLLGLQYVTLRPPLAVDGYSLPYGQNLDYLSFYLH